MNIRHKNKTKQNRKSAGFYVTKLHKAPNILHILVPRDHC